MHYLHHARQDFCGNPPFDLTDEIDIPLLHWREAPNRPALLHAVRCADEVRIVLGLLPEPNNASDGEHARERRSHIQPNCYIRVIGKLNSFNGKGEAN